jgi:hypothetical protein
MEPVRILSVVITLLLLLSACAGRSAHPVMVYQHGDEERSCDALERELELIEDDILSLLPETDKADRNTRLGITGIFLLVPFLYGSQQVRANRDECPDQTV